MSGMYQFCDGSSDGRRGGKMKVYILADMEGISGIRKIEQVKIGNPEYEKSRKLVMDEMNVAIDAACSAGASEVVACDTHGMGGQIDIERMDKRAVYETPNPSSMMPALDESFDGVILLGHHAKAGTLNAFLDHTISSDSWYSYRVNGQEVGEIGIEAAYAGHYDVPVIAVSGDAATAKEARELFGKVETAVVKEAIGRNRARCYSIEAAHEAVRQAIVKSVENIGNYKPWKPDLPAEVELRLYRTDMADAFGGRPDIKRIDARTVGVTVDSLRYIRPF